MALSARAAPRTQTCGGEEARARLGDARAQLQFANLVEAGSAAEDMKATISCAVLAGIAAADAACCKALGQRSRSQDHRDAVKLLSQVSPGGPEASKALGRLLAMKGESQYGFHAVGGKRLGHAKQRAEALVAFAETVLQR